MVNLIGGRTTRGVDLDTALDPARKDLLEARWADAEAWFARCDRGNSPGPRARTPALRPELEDELTLPGLEAALHELASARAAKLGRMGDGAAGAPGGRLLLCEVDMALGGGEAEAASRGLFDVDDRPPWDLWLVAFGRTHPSQPDDPITCLLAWLPEEWIPLGQLGIEASRAGALAWVDPPGP